MLIALATSSCGALAAPGDELFFDNFNGNLKDWTLSSSGGDASLGNETRKQGRALRLRWGVVSATSDPFDASVPGARLDVWIRRGADSFSEDPDAGEDLVVEYLSQTGNWIELLRYGGDDDSPGDIYMPSVQLPEDALHASLRLRFRMTGGSGEDDDYWHIDEPTVIETEAVPESVSPQFWITHDGFGIRCVEEVITVDVVDAATGSPLLDYNATVTLDAQSGSGSWSRLSGGGSFSDVSADDGIATYDWPLGESSAVFALY